MDSDELWPFFFEVNLLQRTRRRERTVFVQFEEDGKSRWEDFAGRMTRRGGFGGIQFRPGEDPVHTRGGQALSEAEEQAEREAFTVSVALSGSEFTPIRELIERVGKTFREGWPPAEAKALHRLLEEVYWKRINHLMHEPFDPTDS